MSAFSTSRHFATLHQFGRIWSEAGIGDVRPAWLRCVLTQMRHRLASYIALAKPVPIPIKTLA